MYIGLLVKYALILSDFNEMNFLYSFSEKYVLNFMKIRDTTSPICTSVNRNHEYLHVEN